MIWDRKERAYWCVGDREAFRLSRDNSARFLYALVACEGSVHETFSLDIHDGVSPHGLRPHETAVLFHISLPVGAEARFEQLTWPGILEVPDRVTGNRA